MNCTLVLEGYKSVLSDYNHEIIKKAVSCSVGVIPGVGIIALNALQSLSCIYLLLQPKRIYSYEMQPLNGLAQSRRNKCLLIVGLSIVTTYSLISILYNSIFRIAFFSFTRSFCEKSIKYVNLDFSYCNIIPLETLFSTGNNGIFLFKKHLESYVESDFFSALLVALSITTLAVSIFCTQRGVISTGKCIYAVILMISLAACAFNLSAVLTANKCHFSTDKALNQWAQFLNQSIEMNLNKK